MDTERLRVGAGIGVVGAVFLLVGHTAGSDSALGPGLWAIGWIVLAVGLVMLAVGLLRRRPGD